MFKSPSLWFGLIVLIASSIVDSSSAKYVVLASIALYIAERFRSRTIGRFFMMGLGSLLLVFLNRSFAISLSPTIAAASICLSGAFALMASWEVLNSKAEPLLSFMTYAYFLIAALVVSFAHIFHIYGLRDGEAVVRDLDSAIYFSLVTWTTIGYGDLCPTPEVRIAAGLEGVLGAVTFATMFGMAFAKIDPGKPILTSLKTDQSD